MATLQPLCELRAPSVPTTAFQLLLHCALARPCRCCSYCPGSPVPPTASYCLLLPSYCLLLPPTLPWLARATAAATHPAAADTHPDHSAAATLANRAAPLPLIWIAPLLPLIQITPLLLLIQIVQPCCHSYGSGSPAGSLQHCTPLCLEHPSRHCPLLNGWSLPV